MPQDIPLEASDLLAFTPQALAEHKDAPTLTLRAPTWRDKRYQKRLLRENGIRSHDKQALRDEIMRGLKALWTAEDFANHSPKLRAYWEAQDDFELQQKEDPALEWSYDPVLEGHIEDLLRAITREWKPFGIMRADNAEFGEMFELTTAAVVLTGWTGLDVACKLDGGYPTLDTISDLEDAFEAKFGEKAGRLAWAQVLAACSARLYLDEETAKNFVSPAPSETNPSPSTETITSDKDGKSPVQASSTKTPETA